MLSPPVVAPAQPEERALKRFMLLHYGFEKPTEEIMKAWGAWFESIAERNVEQGGFSAASPATAVVEERGRRASAKNSILILTVMQLLFSMSTL